MKQSQKNEGPQVVLYFQVHQPKRLKRIKFLDIGNSNSLFDEDLNHSIIKRVSENCYLPMNEKLLKLINRFPGIKICFSLSGTVIEQLAETQPRVLASFRALAQTGSVEFLGETYYHSLSSLAPGEEFITQVNDHSKLIEHHFGVRPTVFRNTELIYSTSIASKVAQLGFKGILCDGVERILDERNPYQVYGHPVQENFKILLRSNTLSDDIAFRFNHNDKPLNVQEYCNWIYNVPGNNSVVLLGMDYETFGEHHPRSTGIMSFLEAVLMKLHVEKRATLATPSMVIAESNAVEKLDVHNFISWADEAKDISAWLGNEMQRDAFKTLNSIEEYVIRTNDMDLIAKWRHLQSSDHFYYMCTKGSNDGNVHSYFSHYGSPYEAFINYMNSLADLSLNFADVVQHKKQPDFEYERQYSEVPY
jgi:alpha-amylase